MVIRSSTSFLKWLLAKCKPWNERWILRRIAPSNLRCFCSYSSKGGAKRLSHYFVGVSHFSPSILRCGEDILMGKFSG